MTKTVATKLHEISHRRHNSDPEVHELADEAADWIDQLVGTLRVVAGLIHDALPSAQGSAAEVLAHAYEAIETTLVGVAVEPNEVERLRMALVDLTTTNEHGQLMSIKADVSDLVGPLIGWRPAVRTTPCP